MVDATGPKPESDDSKLFIILW